MTATANDDIVVAPTLRTIGEGIIVTTPVAMARAAQVGEGGGISIGPGHLPDIGPALHICVTSPDGTNVIATMGPHALRAFARLVVKSVMAIDAGEYDRPEVRQ